MVSGVRTLRRAGTPIDPTQAVQTVVTDGPFRFTRNPLYLSLTLTYGGVALLTGAVGALVVLPVMLVVVVKGVIVPEERYLEAKFGDAYRQYKGRVRRWL
jgi:protein-S-isoprenylcysteine O-methyltransferase Ste14